MHLVSNKNKTNIIFFIFSTKLQSEYFFYQRIIIQSKFMSELMALHSDSQLLSPCLVTVTSNYYHVVK
jgi:uncharacterized protein YqkB